MEQTINLQDVRELLPSTAQIKTQKKRGEKGGYLEIEVLIKPPLQEKEYEDLKSKIISHFGEDLLEVYTEETGHWFYIYVRMSSTQPTTVVI
jgi:hypothetical protein